MNDRIIASIGLISDTHFQERLFDLPTGVGELLSENDLILHAGDVGDLDVLDLLGKFAPTIAVQGNDEPRRAKEELPHQQLVTVRGTRILMWHSHYSDPVEEKANRGGTWGPKLERIARRGRDVDAGIVVYGHTHVPLVSQVNGVLLINPGAMASGSYFTRQAVRSVGRLQLLANGEIDIIHFDVDKGEAAAFNEPNPDVDFGAFADRYQEWIVEPGLIPVIGALGQIAYEDVRAVVRTIIPLYRQSLSTGPMRREELISVISASELITSNDRKSILGAIGQDA